VTAIDTSIYLSGNYGPVTDEVTAFDLPVIGELPADLAGRYLRNGPNPIDRVDPKTHHWFMGDGMVHGIRLREGVLMGGKGPAYETSAEIGMARAFGADAACMSSVHEVDLAAALGLATAAVSCITNYGTGISATALTHHEVEEVANAAAGRLEALLAGAVAGLG